ncbi:MAG TPA: HAMP domain-containing sensor histidine kinase [Anaeromyxobacter sp.]|nr:HAMP domain-containing sensor histidine kinase [Anaeromyxobacter sp.]
MRPSRRIAAPAGADPLPLPPWHEEAEREELSRLFGHMVALRLALVPVVLALLAWLAAVDVTPWRRALLAAAGAAVAVFVVVEWLRFRRRGFTPAATPLNVGFATLAVSTVAFASGGLTSPFLFMLMPFAALNGLFSPSPLHVLVPALQVAALWTLWAVAFLAPPAEFHPAALGGGGTPALLTLLAVLGTIVVVAVTGIGRLTRATLLRTLRRTLHAQQESLRAHADRAQELTALSGEIAHELKNPLASVKGLASLLARDVPGGKPAERLAVLRREVDRMQSVLDGFLDLSRPLVPLALGACDVAALCRETAALHEGMGRERGVEVTAAAGEVQVRCDPRKVKQVLINLVQNAIEASPRGAAVALEACAEGGGARVRVLDRGPGVDAALGDLVWQPGVTTKPKGSGLGLTIARAIARQHGGDLVLRPRDGGGTVAELSLPRDPQPPARG